MNINFTPTNTRPNFQARFSDDQETKKALRELAKKEPTIVYQAHLALKDIPYDDKIEIRNFLDQYEVINKTTSRSFRIDKNNTLDLLDTLRGWRPLFDKNTYVTSTYELPANTTVRVYKEAAKPKGMDELKNELIILDQQIAALEEKRISLFKQCNEMEKQQADGVADAIMNDIYLL